MEKAPKSVLLGTGIFSFSVLLLEFCLTRIFAVTIWYYFGFFVISLALMGTVLAAVACLLYNNFFGNNYKKYIFLFSLLFSISTPLSLAFHLHFNFSEYYIVNFQFYIILALQSLFFLFCFFSAGMCICIIFFRYVHQIGKIYFCDLLGASLASLLFIPLINTFSPLAMCFLISSLACIAGLLIIKNTNYKKLKLCISLTALITLTLFFVNDRLHLLRINFVKDYSQSKLQKKEKDIIFEKWSPVSRITVTAPRETKGNYMPKLNAKDKYEYMKISNNSGAPTSLFRFDENFMKTKGKHNINTFQIVHLIKQKADMLVIGVGGGIDVLWGLYFDQKSITAVEINPLMTYLVKKKYKNYIGRIFENPKVSLHTQDGRNFVAGTSRKYDIIQISMTDSWTGIGGGFIFNENYLFTKEAIHDYISHLNKDGILSMVRYYSYDETLRLTNTIVESLQEKNIKNIHKRIIVVRNQSPAKSYRQYGTILVKNGVFSPKEVDKIAAERFNYRGNIVYAPYINSQNLEQSQYASLFHNLINQQHSKQTHDEIISTYPRNISSTSDDKPFFFYMAKPKNIFQIYKPEHTARRLAMPILYGIFIIQFVLSILIILFPLLLSSKFNIPKSLYSFQNLLYFAAIGMGYMLVEMSLIHRFTMFLGHPTYSFLIVLTTLLFSSSIGSLISGRGDFRKRLIYLYLALGIIVLFGTVYTLFVIDLLNSLLWLKKIYHILLTIVIVGSLGIFMGMCFPIGMQIAVKINKRLVPWGWGINGMFSVFATTLSFILALNFGFKVTMLSGILCYFAALLLVLNFKHSHVNS